MNRDSVQPPSATYGLEELCAAAQAEIDRRCWPSPGGRVAHTLNARNVRYYTTTGLVDRPSGYQGGVAHYGPRHVLQLVAIKALQTQFVPLPEIQRRLFGRSDAELQAVVEAVPGETPATTTLDTWLTCSPAPGLRLVVEDRAAFLEWIRGHSGEELQDRIEQAMHLLIHPSESRSTPHDDDRTAA